MRFTQSNDDHNNNQRSLKMDNGKNLHRLLNRQVSKYLTSDLAQLPEVKELIHAVNQAYTDFDSDIVQLQHTLDLSSKELSESNEKLTHLNKNLSDEIEKRTTEIELKNQQLLLAQQYANIGSFEINFVTQTSTFTPKAAELIGFTPEELSFSDDLIKKMRRKVLKDDLPAIDEAWIRSFTEKCDVELDFRIVDSATNELIHVHWIVKVNYSSNGLLKSVSGTLQDITDRVKHDEKLRIADQIIQSSSAIFIKWKADESKTISFISDNLGQFGYTIEDLKSIEGQYFRLIHSEDVEHCQEMHSKMLRGETDEITLSYRLIQKDKTYRWVEERSKSHKNAIGNVIHTQGIVIDISERKAAELALEKSENKFKNLVVNSKDIITLLDQNGTVVYESPCFYRQFGYTEDEVIGKNSFDFVHPEDVEMIMDAFKKVAETPDDAPLCIFRYRHKDGHYITLEGIGNNQLANEAIRAIIVNSRDISERVESEKKMQEYSKNLEKINKELDQFAYIVSHDLKAPLRAINNLSIWIEEDLSGKMDDDVAKNLSLMRSRIHRMEELINGILQYSRAGRMHNPTETINTKEFVSELIQNLCTKPEFKFEVSQTMPTIETERIVVEQVFSNYISNALKYNSNPEPLVKIEYTENTTHHIFSVTDNGNGIAPQFHDKVFQIFQTLQARDSSESTGVGLAIVKKLVEDKGGRVWLESEEGKGASFFFSIPKIK